MGFYREQIFPRILEWSMGHPALDRLRERAVSGAKGCVLEIGFGTGRNLEHYPKAVKSIVAVDPNPGMTALARARVSASSIEVQHHQITAERLPFESQSFDCVVSTLTLCSIPDVHNVLTEVRRVLRRGGDFLFLEHGRHPSSRMKRWHNRLNPLWGLMFDGCNLNRDIGELVTQANFQLRTVDHPALPKAPKWLGYGYLGSAQRID